MISSRSAPHNNGSNASPRIRWTLDRVRTPQHGVSLLRARRAFSITSNCTPPTGAGRRLTDSRAVKPLRLLASQEGTLPRANSPRPPLQILDNSFRDHPNRQGFRPHSQSPAGGTSRARRTMKHSGPRAASLIQIDDFTHSVVSVVPFVAVRERNGGEFANVPKRISQGG